MSGLCSRHRDHDPFCKLCNTDPRDVFPDWDEKMREAEAAGTCTCECGFVYYKTARSCPLCGKTRHEREARIRCHNCEGSGIQQERASCMSCNGDGYYIAEESEDP